MPRISVGLPVYNGAKYLPEAIDSILSQTYRHFELIISDNASTDETEAICRRYATQDKRITYVRQQKNMGAAWNFNCVVHMASGDYFKWASHDDLCAENFLSSCLEILETDESVVLCHSEVMIIDSTGTSVDAHNYYHHHRLSCVDSFEPHIRFSDLILTLHYCYDVFGLIRADLLRKTPLIGSYAGSDRNLLAELGLLGRFYKLPEVLFFARDHVEKSTRKFPQLSSYAQWFVADQTCPITFPHWRHVLEYIRSVRRTKLTRSQKTSCYFTIARYMRWYWHQLKDDLLSGAKRAFRRV